MLESLLQGVQYDISLDPFQIIFVGPYFAWKTKNDFFFHDSASFVKRARIAFTPEGASSWRGCFAFAIASQN